MKRTREERKHRLSLTLLFAGIIFVFMLITMLLVVGAFLLLEGTHVIPAESEFLRTNTFFMLFALVCILAGTVLSASFGRVILRPVNTIINSMNRLAGGDFKTRLSFGGPMGRYPLAKELTESFNKMASELENTELLRSDFVNNFSHEFKTPIVSIAGFAKLLKRGNLKDTEQREYLDIIEDESLRLSAMATNVLNMTKVENQEILTDVAEFNLSEQIRNCVLLLENKWSKKHLELLIDFHEYSVVGNQELLKEVWLNLLDNAIKFSPDGGAVQVEITEAPETVAITIVNMGEEIPDDKQERIFQKFYQADESHATEGSGIGLAIVKRVVDLHGGTVTVDSRKDRTAFTVRLPKIR